MRKWAAIIFLILVLGCTKTPQTPPVKHPDLNLPQLPLESRKFEVGTAGLFVRNFPDSTEEDYKIFTEEAQLVGGWVGDYEDWTVDWEKSGLGFLTYVKNVKPLVAIGFNHNDVKKGYFVENREAMKQKVREVFEKFPDLEYFAFGVEVNRIIYETDQQSFDEFVETYKQVYDMVKEMSPNAKVFTIFQLDYMKGDAYLSGLEIEPHWSVLGRFDGKMDLVGLTIYPFIEYKTVDEIPENYYSEINEHINKPIAITETAWLSQDFVNNGATMVEGSEQAQVDFMLDLLAATEYLDVEFLMWSFLYEPGGDIEPMFRSAALKTNNGREKMIYGHWRALNELERK